MCGVIDFQNEIMPVQDKDSDLSETNMAANQNNESASNGNDDGGQKLEDKTMPAFIKTYELGMKIDGYQLGCLINDEFGMRVCEGTQEVRGLFRVYMLRPEWKAELCERGLTINNRKITVYDVNPHRSGSTQYETGQEEVKMVKLTIRDLYKSVSMKDTEHMLCNVYKLELASDIRFGNYREENGELSYMMNYDRYVYVHPDQLQVPLPRNAQCGIYKCRIFYPGQIKPSKACFNCYQTDHISRNCPNGKCCKICKEPGHFPGSPFCLHYTPAHPGMRVFGGEKDPLSNHFMENFTWNEVEGKSAEHHWFNWKANANGQPELANEIFKSGFARDAKYLGKGIRCVPGWDSQDRAYDTMLDILRVKFTHVKAARDALYECWLNKWSIVHAVNANHYSIWGTSLSQEATLHTDPSMWQGDNKMGKILTDLMFEFWGEWEDSWSTDPNNEGSHAFMP